jgi:hypothetical protein
MTTTNRYYAISEDNVALVCDSHTGKFVWEKAHHYDGWIVDSRTEVGRAIDQARRVAAELNSKDS